jgi:hypothetical protein
MSLSARAIAVGGIGFSPSLMALSGLSDYINIPTIVRRRSGLGSLKIKPKLLPEYLEDLEELFEAAPNQEKSIRAKVKRDEFFILN